jgi:hypothetical protein
MEKTPSRSVVPFRLITPFWGTARRGRLWTRTPGKKGARCGSRYMLTILGCCLAPYLHVLLHKIKGLWLTLR